MIFLTVPTSEWIDVTQKKQNDIVERGDINLLLQKEENIVSDRISVGPCIQLESSLAVILISTTILILKYFNIYQRKRNSKVYRRNENQPRESEDNVRINKRGARSNIHDGDTTNSTVCQQPTTKDEIKQDSTNRNKIVDRESELDKFQNEPIIPKSTGVEQQAKDNYSEDHDKQQELNGVTGGKEIQNSNIKKETLKSAVSSMKEEPKTKPLVHIRTNFTKGYVPPKRSPYEYLPKQKMIYQKEKMLPSGLNTENNEKNKDQIDIQNTKLPPALPSKVSRALEAKKSPILEEATSCKITLDDKKICENSLLNKQNDSETCDRRNPADAVKTSVPSCDAVDDILSSDPSPQAPRSGGRRQEETGQLITSKKTENLKETIIETPKNPVLETSMTQNIPKKHCKTSRSELVTLSPEDFIRVSKAQYRDCWQNRQSWKPVQYPIAHQTTYHIVTSTEEKDQHEEETKGNDDVPCIAGLQDAKQKKGQDLQSTTPIAFNSTSTVVQDILHRQELEAKRRKEKKKPDIHQLLKEMKAVDTSKGEKAEVPVSTSPRSVTSSATSLVEDILRRHQERKSRQTNRQKIPEMEEHQCRENNDTFKAAEERALLPLRSSTVPSIPSQVEGTRGQHQENVKRELLISKSVRPRANLTKEDNNAQSRRIEDNTCLEMKASCSVKDKQEDKMVALLPLGRSTVPSIPSQVESTRDQHQESVKRELLISKSVSPAANTTKEGNNAQSRRIEGQDDKMMIPTSPHIVIEAKQRCTTKTQLNNQDNNVRKSKEASDCGDNEAIVSRVAIIEHAKTNSKSLDRNKGVKRDDKIAHTPCENCVVDILFEVAVVIALPLIVMIMLGASFFIAEFTEFLPSEPVSIRGRKRIQAKKQNCLVGLVMEVAIVITFVAVCLKCVSVGCNSICLVR